MLSLIEEEAKRLTFYYTDARKSVLKTYFEANSQILHLTWYGLVPIEDIMNAYLLLGEYHKDNGYIILKALVDLTYLEGSFEAHNDWMIKYYWPKAMQYGYYQTAFVMSNDYYANLSLMLLHDEYKNHIARHEIKIFNTIKEAEEWLRS